MDHGVTTNNANPQEATPKSVKVLYLARIKAPKTCAELEEFKADGLKTLDMDLIRTTKVDGRDENRGEREPYPRSRGRD